MPVVTVAGEGQRNFLRLQRKLSLEDTHGRWTGDLWFPRVRWLSSTSPMALVDSALQIEE